MRIMLRFGIMCNGMKLAAWEADCVKKLLAIEEKELALLIVDRENTSVASTRSRIKRVGWYGWYLFNLFFVKRQTRAIQLCDISSLVAGVPQLECKIIRKGKFSQYFQEDDVKAIKSYDLDFILRFGFGIIRGDVLNAARFGVWSFYHGDEEKYRGGPPGFWEMYFNDPVTGAILQRLTDRLDGGIILKKGFLKTNLISYAKNRDAIHFVSANWPVQVCRDIENHNADYLESALSKSTAPVYKVPTNLQMIIFIGKVVWRQVKQWFFSVFFYYQWNIGIVEAPISTFLLSDPHPPIRWLPFPPYHSFRADPFGRMQNGTVQIVFEDYRYRDGRGFISAMSIEGGRISGSRLVLDPGIHISYPYLIAYNGETYCIPETSKKGETMLYRAKEFPFSWEKVTTIINDFTGVDNTVFFYQGRWWLMTMNAASDAVSELDIWHASMLFGPWEPHILNPVQVDVRSSRPAGTPFFHKDKLYRPAQGCSYLYGQRICLNRIVELTPTSFREEIVYVINPDPEGPYPLGAHTLSSAGTYTLVDGVRRVATWKSASVLLYKLRRVKSIFHANFA